MQSQPGDSFPNIRQLFASFCYRFVLVIELNWQMANLFFPSFFLYAKSVILIFNIAA